MGAIAGYNASILAVNANSVAITFVPMADQGDHKTFVVGSSDYATKRYWDYRQSVVVHISSDNGATFSTVSPSLYTLQYVNGTVFFNSAQNPTGLQVKCDFQYFSIYTLATAKSWEIQLNDTALDSTTFGSNGWKTFVMGLNDATVKIDQWWTNYNFYANLNAQALIVISLYTGQTATQRYEAYAFVKQDSVKTVVSGLVEDSFELNVFGQIYYIA